MAMILRQTKSGKLVEYSTNFERVLSNAFSEQKMRKRFHLFQRGPSDSFEEMVSFAYKNEPIYSYNLENKFAIHENLLVHSLLRPKSFIQTVQNVLYGRHEGKHTRWTGVVSQSCWDTKFITRDLKKGPTLSHLISLSKENPHIFFKIKVNLSTHCTLSEKSFPDNKYDFKYTLNLIENFYEKRHLHHVREIEFLLMDLVEINEIYPFLTRDQKNLIQHKIQDLLITMDQENEK